MGSVVTRLPLALGAALIVGACIVPSLDGEFSVDAGAEAVTADGSSGASGSSSSSSSSSSGGTSSSSSSSSSGTADGGKDTGAPDVDAGLPSGCPPPGTTSFCADFESNVTWDETSGTTEMSAENSPRTTGTHSLRTSGSSAYVRKGLPKELIGPGKAVTVEFDFNVKTLDANASYVVHGAFRVGDAFSEYGLSADQTTKGKCGGLCLGETAPEDTAPALLKAVPLTFNRWHHAKIRIAHNANDYAGTVSVDDANVSDVPSGAIPTGTNATRLDLTVGIFYMFKSDGKAEVLIDNVVVRPN